MVTWGDRVSCLLEYTQRDAGQVPLDDRRSMVHLSLQPVLAALGAQGGCISLLWPCTELKV